MIVYGVKNYRLRHCGQTVKLLSKFSNFYRVKLLSFNTSLFLEKQDIDKLSFSDSVVKSSHYIRIIPENLGFPGGSDSKESACNVGDLGSIPGLGISLGEGNGYPLQYFCLEISMNRGPWRATVHGIAKSWTLSLFSTTSIT